MLHGIDSVACHARICAGMPLPGGDARDPVPRAMVLQAVCADRAGAEQVSTCGELWTCGVIACEGLSSGSSAACDLWGNAQCAQLALSGR